MITLPNLLVATVLFCVFYIITVFLTVSSRILTALYCFVVVFILISLIFMICGFEYISLIYILIYLGAVVILYLIAVYTVGTQFFDNLETKSRFYTKTINWIILFFFFLFSIFLYFNTKGFFIHYGYNFVYTVTKNVFTIVFMNNNPQIDTIAYILYDYCPIAIILGGLILFVALIGVIILTKSFEGNTLATESKTFNLYKMEKKK